MHRISRLLRLSNREKALLLQTTILLGAIRLGLSTLPFATLRKMLARLAAAGSRTEDQPGGAAGEPTVWAVETVSRQFPAIGTCLTQALAAQVLLARRGHQSNLGIGVTRTSSGKFVAHAWLETDGVILIGGAGQTNYTPMPVLNGLES